MLEINFSRAYCLVAFLSAKSRWVRNFQVPIQEYPTGANLILDCVSSLV